MLTIPESLLLFSLHDRRGTPSAASYLGLPVALRGSVLAELLLRGRIRVQRDGSVRWRTREGDLDSPLLRAAEAALVFAKNGDPVDVWARMLEQGMPDLQQRLSRILTARGALSTDVADREGLVDTPVWPSADGRLEAMMLDHVKAGIAAVPNLNRRVGMLVGMIHVCSIWPQILDASSVPVARTAGEWVVNRDALCSATRTLVHRAEGTYEG